MEPDNWWWTECIRRAARSEPTERWGSTRYSHRSETAWTPCTHEHKPLRSSLPQFLLIRSENQYPTQTDMNTPPRDHEFLFLGFGANLGVNVNGEECAGTVKDGSEWTHQRGQHDGQHQPSETFVNTHSSLEPYHQTDQSIRDVKDRNR